MHIRWLCFSFTCTPLSFLFLLSLVAIPLLYSLFFRVLDTPLCIQQCLFLEFQANSSLHPLFSLLPAAAPLGLHIGLALFALLRISLLSIVSPFTYNFPGFETHPPAQIIFQRNQMTTMMDMYSKLFHIFN